MTDQAFRARVTVHLGAGVNDPQGNTVRDGLRALGYPGVRDVRVGKTIDLVVEAADADEARGKLESMCHELLANPVIETYEIDLAEVAPR